LEVLFLLKPLGFAAPELAARIKDANAKAIITCTYGMDGYKKLHYKPIVNEAIGLAEMPSIKTIVYQRDGERVDYTDFDFEELTKKGKS
jgi:propionyl-CoA synthetase